MINKNGVKYDPCGTLKSVETQKDNFTAWEQLLKYNLIKIKN